MYILNNKTYTPEVLTKAAEKQGLTLEELIAKKGIKPYTKPETQPEADITSAEGMQNLTYYTPDGEAYTIKGAQKNRFLQAFPDAMTLEEVQEKQAEYKKALAEQQRREKERATKDDSREGFG